MQPNFICTVRCTRGFEAPDATCLSMKSGDYLVITKQRDPNWWCARQLKGGLVENTVGLVPSDHVELVGQGLILPGLEPSLDVVPVKKKKKKKKVAVVPPKEEVKPAESAEPEKTHSSHPKKHRKKSGPSLADADKAIKKLEKKLAFEHEKHEAELDRVRAAHEEELRVVREDRNRLLARKEEELTAMRHKVKHLKKSNKSLTHKINSMALCLRCGADLREQKGSAHHVHEEDEAEGEQEDQGLAMLVSEGYDREVLLKFKRMIRSMVLRRRFRAVALDFKNHKASLVMRLRNESLREIYTSEKKYVSSLEAAMEQYYHPMLRLAHVGNKPVVQRAEVMDIFSTLEIIVELNRGLLLDLKQRLDAWPSVQQFGDLFIRMAPILRLYTGYVRNYEVAQRTLLRKRESSPPFCDFLLEREPAAGLPLESFLIMPIQRLPRYQMLLSGLLKYTDERHVDYADLVKAQENIVTICSDINYQKRVDENTGALRQLVEEVEGLYDVLGTEAFFIHRGHLHSIKGANIDSFHYILFSDAMVRCAPVSKRRGWVVVESTPLSKVVGVKDIPDMEGIKNCLEIECTAMKGEGFLLEKPVTIGLCALTSADKDSWISRVNAYLEVPRSDYTVRILADATAAFKGEVSAEVAAPPHHRVKGISGVSSGANLHHSQSNAMLSPTSGSPGATKFRRTLGRSTSAIPK